MALIEIAQVARAKSRFELVENPTSKSLVHVGIRKYQHIKTAIQAIGQAKKLMETQQLGLVEIENILARMSFLTQQVTVEKPEISNILKTLRDRINSIVLASEWNQQSLLGGKNIKSDEISFVFNLNGDIATFHFQPMIGGLRANQSFYSNISGGTENSISTSTSKIIASKVRDAHTELMDGETYSLIIDNSESKDFYLKIKDGSQIASSNASDGTGNEVLGWHSVPEEITTWDTGVGVAINFDSSDTTTPTAQIDFVYHASSVGDGRDLGLCDDILQNPAKNCQAAIDYAQLTVEQALAQVEAFQYRITHMEKSLLKIRSKSKLVFH